MTILKSIFLMAGWLLNTMAAILVVYIVKSEIAPSSIVFILTPFLPF